MVVLKPLAGPVIATAAGGPPRLTLIGVELEVPKLFVQETLIELLPLARVTEPLAAAPAFWAEALPLVALVIVQVAPAGTTLAPATV